MWGAVVCYLVATIFVVACSEPGLCLRGGDGGMLTMCHEPDVNYTLNFIPPISRNISYISFSGQPIRQLPYNVFRNLSTQSSIYWIRLLHCQISHVDAGALLNLHSLTAIDLSYNDINHTDSKLFSDTKQIKFISMGNNMIEVIPSGLFQNLMHLEVVHLFDNRIHQVEWFSFNNTPSLLIITLNNNQIEYMNMLFKDNFDNLTTLLLDGNPWQCNCELGPLYEIIIKLNQSNEQELVCEKPPSLQGRNWSDINREEFVCPPSNLNWILYTIIVLIIGVVLVVRYILVKAHKRRHVLVPSIEKRTSFRRDTRDMDSDLSMGIIQSKAVSENGDSASNTDDVDEKQTSVQHCEIREATIN